MLRGEWTVLISQSWFAEHRLDEDEAFVVARDLAYQLVRRAYKF